MHIERDSDEECAGRARERQKAKGRQSDTQRPAASRRRSGEEERTRLAASSSTWSSSPWSRSTVVVLAHLVEVEELARSAVQVKDEHDRREANPRHDHGVDLMTNHTKKTHTPENRQNKDANERMRGERDKCRVNNQKEKKQKNRLIAAK